ncbi:MAG: hypothetical protein KF683_22555 [Rubrivivax sp.]|nr:hypothetical protein [Rubrivivax sp.]
MRGRREEWSRSALLLLGGSLWLAAQVQAAERASRCTGVAPVAAMVSGADAADFASACEGVRDALGFLARLDLALPEQLSIHVADRLPPDLRADAVGCYSIATRRISVLSSREFLARGRWFGVPTSRPLYRSIVAHEVAHAVIGCHLAGRRLPTAAHEYAAYVVMFATMDAEVREQALAAWPPSGLVADSNFNDLTYVLDPMSFGVAAYRHWQRQPDGAAFLRRVIAGDVVPDLGTM